MKKLSFVLLSLFSFVYLSSQTVLTYENHALTPGDQHHFILTENAEEGPNGTDQIWDFSWLKATGELFSKMHETDLNVSGANMFIDEFGNKFYFNVSKSIIEEYGIVSCGDNKIQYEKPAVKMVFPFRYGDIYNNDFHGYTTSGNQKTSISGTDKHEADAFGTLILPGNIKISDVLRLKSTRTRIYGSCNSISTTTYRWYSENVRYPLLTIIKQEHGEQKNYVRTAYYANAKQDIEESLARKEKTKQNVETFIQSQGDNTFVKAFPSPFETYVEILYRIVERTNIVIEIFNNNGRKIHSINKGVQEPGVYTHRINEEDISLSTEMLHINVLTNNEILKTKVIKSK